MIALAVGYWLLGSEDDVEDFSCENGDYVCPVAWGSSLELFFRTWCKLKGKVTFV